MHDVANFDGIAKYYDRLARIVFGSAIRDAQTCFLDRIPDHSNVLVLGGGSGWWLNGLIAQKPACKIRYIEVSAGMLELARKNSKTGSQIEFVLGTEESTGVGQFDVVITYFFLDLFDEERLQHVVDIIKGKLASKGVWLVSDFVNTRWWHGPALFIMYRFFRTTTGLKTKKLVDWNNSLRANGLCERETRLFYRHFIKSVVFVAE
jgi:tRNA (cmo5U34)-methyltransferase